MQQEAAPAPNVVRDLADACVRYVREAVGVELDYTQDTLPLLDHWVTLVPEATEQVLGLVAPMCGAYFGEVVRRHLGGARWHAPDEEYNGWRIEFDPCFMHFNPVGMAVEAFLRQEAEGWAGHLQVLDEDREALKDALEELGEVPEDDFYRLSVRYEVIEQAHAFLTARQAKDGDERRRFGPEVYAALAGERQRDGVKH